MTSVDRREEQRKKKSSPDQEEVISGTSSWSTDNSFLVFFPGSGQGSVLIYGLNAAPFPGMN